MGNLGPTMATRVCINIYERVLNHISRRVEVGLLSRLKWEGLRARIDDEVERVHVPLWDHLYIHTPRRPR
jgi:hypothetical protein